jgi:hypothetical protein
VIPRNNTTFELAGLKWSRLLPTSCLPTTERTAAALDVVERQYRVEFPPEYRAIAAAIQGCTPTPDLFVIWDFGQEGIDFEMEGRLRSLDMFLLLCKGARPNMGLRTMSFQLNLVRDAAPGLVPIAVDRLANLVCLDFGDDWTDPEPSVAYFDRERKDGDEIFPVSASFDDFLLTLMDPGEEAKESISSEE